MVDELREVLLAIPPGPVTDVDRLDVCLARAWDEFTGDDGGMIGEKLIGRMESVHWDPPRLTFTIERHGGTVLGSTRATLQHWTVDVERKTVACALGGHRQLRPMAQRLNVDPIAEEIASQIVNRRQDERLKWYPDGRVRVLVGKTLPGGSAVEQTLAGRRKATTVGTSRAA
jgi:hypothetical protein